MLPRKAGFLALTLICFFLVACSTTAVSPTAQPNAPQPTNTAPPPATQAIEPTPNPTDTPVPEPTTPPTNVPANKFNSELARQIMERGVIRIGTRPNSLPPFVIVEGGYSGFEVELAEAMVEWMFDDQVAIEWVGLSSGERFSALEQDQVDLLVRTVVHTISRNQVALWSDPYFIGGVRMLVREDGGITAFEDLDGKLVSVIESSAVQELVRAQAATSGVEVVEVPFETGGEALAAFLEGQADAYFDDWILLLIQTAEDPSLQVAGDFLQRQPFAVGVRPGEHEFRNDINQALRAILEDGTYDTIYGSWFDEPHPWTLEEMLDEPPMDV